MWSNFATCSFFGMWIGLSSTVIMYNKFLLAYAGFPYPVALTMWHMLFCSVLAGGLVKSGKVQVIDMSSETYLKAIVPIGACYAGTLWVGNAAYMYLSVSFVQMLKALAPVVIFAVGCLFGTDRFDWATMSNLLLVSTGIAIASFGELNFNLTGVVCQLASIISESVRLVLVQILLQSRGLKLTPIAMLYYVAPCSFAFLLIPFMALEMGKIATDANLVINPFYMLSNAGAVFALNTAVVLLISKTSALTMKIAGITKDWMLIVLSIAVFRSAVTRLNLLGYLIAFCGVCWYNYRKLQAAKAAAGMPTKCTPLVVDFRTATNSS